MPEVPQVDDSAPRSLGAVPAGMRRRIALHHRLNDEMLPAAVLLIAIAVALVWANVGHSHQAFWHAEVGFVAGPVSMFMPLAEWINEGLMAIFFFSVGLEVRREFAIGELRHREQALLPAAAALGGLVVPAIIFVAIAGRSGSGSAWGTVISTDTAFALGVLGLIGLKNAPRLRLFILTLAVVDDIAALTVIAVVYTDDLSLPPLLVAAAGLALIALFGRLRVWRATPMWRPEC